MAILTIPSVTLGTPALVYLSKSELFALAPVAADAYFSVHSKVKWAIAFFEGPGKQREILRFDLSQESPSASLLLSAYARGTFELKRLILEDHDGGYIAIERAELPASLDVLISQAGGGGQAQGGGGNTPQAPSLISSGLALRLETGSGLVDSGGGNYTWTDQVSGRNFVATPSFNGGGGGNFPQIMSQSNFFGSMPGLRLQYGYKMQENSFGSFLFGTLTNATILMVANSTAGDFIDVSQGGMSGLTLSNNQYTPSGPLPQNSIYGLFASGGFGGPPQYTTTNAAPYTPGTSKVIALTLPSLGSNGSKLFVNGSEAMTGAQGMGSVIAGNSQIAFGGYFQPSVQDSTFGAVLIYDRVLSDAEIAAMNTYLSGRYSIV